MVPAALGRFSTNKPADHGVVDASLVVLLSGPVRGRQARPALADPYETGLTQQLTGLLRTAAEP